MPGLSKSLTKGHLILALTERRPPPRKVAKEHKRVREVYDRTAERFVGVYERQAYPTILDYIARGYTDDALLQSLAVSLMTDWPAERLAALDDFTKVFLSNLLYGYNYGAQIQYRAIGGKGKFELKNLAELERLERRAVSMSRYAVVRTLERKLFMWTTSGVLAGYKPSEVPMNYGYLVDVSHKVGILGGYNEGRSRVVKKSWKGGEMQKTWAHAGADLKRRDSHVAVEGMTIGLEELFPVANGVKYPHDWENAGCDEWCNCHCYVEYVPGRNATVEPWNGE